jgi:hypothetical protein
MEAEDYEPAHFAQVMRYLTRSEAAVLRTLIADIPSGEGERIRQAEVPRSTFQAIRRKALLGGWICEREIPTIAALGISRVAVVLAQPYAEHHATFLQVLRDEPSTVVLWTTLDTVLLVAFDSRATSDPDQSEDHGRFDSEKMGWLRHCWEAELTASVGALPAFFDFEGGWSQSILGERPISYPQSLSFDPAGDLRSSAPRQAATRVAFRKYLARYSGVNTGKGAENQWDAIRRRAWERRFRKHGWTSHRSFLVPQALPPVAGVPLSQIVFVTGRLREPTNASTFRSSVLQRIGIAPFLIAHDDSRIILGALSSAARLRTNHGSVLEELQSDLVEIEILRGPLETLRAVVDFRFEHA